MKKAIIILGTAVLLSLCSCLRDWSCQCIDQNDNSTSYAINNQTLLSARAKCKDMGYSRTVGGTTVSETCALQ